jgi:hypothetical protein
LGVRQTFTHESDFPPTPPSGVTSDTVSNTSLRAGVAMPLGRQRVFGRVSAEHVRYDERSELNYNGYDASAGVDWATVGNLSGNVTGTTNRRRVRLSLPGDPLAVPPVAPSSETPLQRSDALEARARLGTAGPLGIDVGYGHRRLKFTDPDIDFESYRQNRANLGVSYQFGGALTAGTGVELEKTDYEAPEPGQTIAESSRRRGVYVTTTWTPTGFSVLSARLVFGKLEHDVDTLRDDSGVTGYASWTWRPTGKLSFVTSLSRVTGRETRLIPTAAVPGAPETPPPVVPTEPSEIVLTETAFTRTTNRLEWRGTWEATAKITVDAGLVYSRGEVSLGEDPESAAASLGVAWRPTRSLSFGCNVTQEKVKRSTSDPRSVGCFGQFLLN